MNETMTITDPRQPIDNPPTGPATTKHQRDLMAHALGLSRSYGQCVTKNSLFVALGTVQCGAVAALCRMGLMYVGVYGPEGSDFYAHVTAMGAAELGVELRRED